MEERVNANGLTGVLDRVFHLSENKTTVRQESMAGLTTFMAMAYILFVNPSILGAAGMDKGAVFTATALSAILGCFLMGFLANYPIAIAPGLGDNAFFTYSVVLAMGIPWQKAMAGVFVASVLFTIISFLKIREKIIDAIPQDLKYAMAAGIGLFIAFVGLQGGGLVVANKSSLVGIGSFTVPTTWLTIFGLFFTGILMAKKIPGSIFYGLVATTVLGLGTGLIKMPSQFISLAPSLKPTFGIGIMNLSAMTSPQMWAVVLIFFLVAFFDTAGTLIGLAQQAGIMKNGKMPRIGRALMADSLSMLGGSVMGTTPTAAYVESSAGIAIGGKTGLTAVVTGLLFMLSMIFSPFLTVVTSILKQKNMDALENAIEQLFFSGIENSQNQILVTNQRQAGLLAKAKQSLEDVVNGIDDAMPLDLVQIDLKNAWDTLGEITGESAPDELITQLFSQFCLGK